MTRPRLVQAAVTAERPSTPMTGFDLPSPGMSNATALPNAAPLRAADARTVQLPCDSAAHAAVAAPLAPTVTCGSACVWLLTCACPNRRCPASRPAAWLPDFSGQH